MDKLLSMTLTVISMKEGFGFDRSIYFSLNEEDKTLQGIKGIGIENYDTNFKVLLANVQTGKTMEERIHEIDIGQLTFNDFMSEIIPISEDSILFRTIRDKTPIIIKEVKYEQLTDDIRFIQKI